jgi:carboxyl-terminal processing protease
MKQRLAHFLLVVVLLLTAAATLATPQSVPLSELFPSPGHTKSAIVINKVLERYHYRKVNLDSSFARQVLVKYLEALDTNRAFFLARDVERFENGARHLDDSLRRGDLDIAFDIFRVYRMRVDERVAHALKLLGGNFDFSRSESYIFEPAETHWATDNAELDELWRKRVMNDFLTLRLADKPDVEIRERLQKRYEGLARRIHQFNGDDVFQTFMNAYTQTLEPHTSFMSPDTSANFDISMKLSLEGIGAVLRGDNEYTVVQSTVPGGPAHESGQIHSGDQIVGVAQGLDGAMEDVVGWRLEDVVDKIRGPKGSVVRLQLLSKATGSTGRAREISLVRNEIKLEDQAATSSVVDQLANGPGLKIGVIEIPAFYRDFEAEGSGNRDFRSTTRDVRRLIEDLVAQGVAGSKPSATARRWPRASPIRKRMRASVTKRATRRRWASVPATAGTAPIFAWPTSGRSGCGCSRSTRAPTCARSGCLPTAGRGSSRRRPGCCRWISRRCSRCSRWCKRPPIPAPRTRASASRPC